MKKIFTLLMSLLLMIITGCTGSGTPTPDVWSIVVAPTILSINNTTFTEGIGGTFTVRASGSPNPTFALNGTLPTGVTFNTTSGILAGVPGIGTSGTYPLTITASNGVSPNATQNFTLTVITPVINELYVVHSSGPASYIGSLPIFVGCIAWPGTFCSAITVYDLTANGDVAPLRTIGGTNPGFTYPVGMAVDWFNNEIMISDVVDNNIKLFERTADGDAAPLRTISGALTGLDSPAQIIVDAVNNEIYVVNNGLVSTLYSITVYNRTDSGNVAPKRIIKGAATDLNEPKAIFLDKVNNEIFVGNFDGNSITVYNRTDSGNVAPKRTITGSATELNNPWGMAVDTTNNEIIVTNNLSNSITVYNRTDDGNVAPKRTIAGAATNLDGVTGISLNTINNEIYVSNGRGNSVTVYNRTDSGNVAPKRTIAGGATGLVAPPLGLVVLP